MNKIKSKWNFLHRRLRLSSPFLWARLPAMFTGCSMVFHTQEGEKYHEHNGEIKPAGLYHEYVRNNVNKTSVNLRCSFRDAPRRCKATLTLEPRDLAVIEIKRTQCYWSVRKTHRSRYRKSRRRRWTSFRRRAQLILVFKNVSFTPVPCFIR